MEERMRSGEHSGIVVKNRSKSGCLIVRKKGDGSDVARSLGTRKIFKSKKEKKRPRRIVSDSGSSDELVMPPRRRVGLETLQVCNDLAVYEESDIGRKRNREERIRRSEEGFTARNVEDFSESKRNRLDVFDFNEYDGLDEEMIMRRNRFDYAGEEVGGRGLLGSMPAVGQRRIEREYEIGTSRHVYLEKKKKKKSLFFDNSDGMSWGDHDERNRFMKDRDDDRLHYSLLRERYMVDSDEPIRVQGKNGVLKVMVNKKKVGESFKNFDHFEVEGARSGSRIENTVRRNLHVHPSLCPETDVLDKPVSLGNKEKKKKKLLKTPTTKKNKVNDWDSEVGDASLKLQPKNMEASNSKRASSKEEKTQVEQVQPSGVKEGKVKRGCGTEKQKLRERIRGMLQEAGWTIDYRPRRNRDYLDAVYINPAGTAYWSIIKAYDALLKQLDEEDEAKFVGNGSSFTPLSDEVLSQLTRKTRKKMEREMKKKRRVDSDSENAQEAVARKSSKTRHEDESMDSLSHEEKLSSLMKAKSSKCSMNDTGASTANTKGRSSPHVHDSSERPSSISNPRLVHGRQSRELGRCTLLVRGSNAGLSSEGDDFVPYSGKLTLLSWLIDSGAVQLSEKVQYMNRRRTKVMLEGWVTRDGIHCGCCSKILSVSKFEIHAGSKLRQPFQNIYLDSGVSLLQCQIDAWNRQEKSEQIGFHTVDIDGDDPNDDTCSICGDGGDLICCDSCPSTFHQSCLSIEFLPAGDWHCPNCICKFCGDGSNIAQKVDTAGCALLTCSLCEKKYHKSCTKVICEVHIDSNGSILPFCGQTCRELFEKLQKYIGVKHELEAGFSWSLVQRTDADSDTAARGLPQRVECNSKLAVARSVMDECFLPIVDRRSGINLIKNVLYNCGSNFNRLNYSGFYSAILERGDEIISAASIRFHGTQLAEMPFIGTRHTYRRQGMCRQLFRAIESALCSLKVQKLVIPAIAELTHTWTAVFGFTALEESLKKEMLSMNMLVFPGIDMLQKLLLEQEIMKAGSTAATDVKQTESGSNERITPEGANESKSGSSSGHDTLGYESKPVSSSGHDSPEVAKELKPVSLSGHDTVEVANESRFISSSGNNIPEIVNKSKSGSSSGHHDTPEVANKLKPDSSSGYNTPEVANESKPGFSSGHDTQEFDDGVLHDMSQLNGKIPTVKLDSRCLNVSSDDTCGTISSLDASVEPIVSVSMEETTIYDQTGDKNQSASVSNCDVKENKLGVVTTAKDNIQSSTEGMDDTCAGGAIESKISASDDGTDSNSGDKAAEPASDNQNLASPSVDFGVVGKGEKTLAESPFQKDALFCEDGDADAAHRGENIASASDVNTELTVEETIPTNSLSASEPAKFPVGKSIHVSNESWDTREKEKKIISVLTDEEDIQSSKGIDTNNVHPVELEGGVSVEKTLLAESELRDKTPVSASPKNSRITGTITKNPAALEKENKSVLDLHSEDLSGSCEEGNMCDKSRISNGGCIPHGKH